MRLGRVGRASAVVRAVRRHQRADGQQRVQRPAQQLGQRAPAASSAGPPRHRRRCPGPGPGRRGPRSARSRSSATRWSSRSSSAAGGPGRPTAAAGTATAAAASTTSATARGLGAGRCGAGQRPGVEERDPAAQHGAVVAVPGAQPPAGAGECRRAARRVRRAGPGPSRSAPAAASGPGPRRRVPPRPSASAAVRAGAQAAAPSAQRASAHGVGEHGTGLPGQFRAAAACPRAGGAPAGAPGRHGPAGGGKRSTGDESEPGVARGTGRHRSSLAAVGPKAQSEPGLRSSGAASAADPSR